MCHETDPGIFVRYGAQERLARERCGARRFASRKSRAGTRAIVQLLASARQLILKKTRTNVAPASSACVSLGGGGTDGVTLAFTAPNATRYAIGARIERLDRSDDRRSGHYAA